MFERETTLKKEFLHGTYIFFLHLILSKVPTVLAETNEKG